MPSMKLGLACAAIVVCSSIAHAQMDVRSLLTKIGFADDDPPSVQEPAADGELLPPAAAADLTSGAGDLLIPDGNQALDTVEPRESLSELPTLAAPTPAPLNDVPWLADSPQTAAEPLEQIDMNALQASPLQAVPGAATSQGTVGPNNCRCAGSGQCGCRGPRVAGAPCLPAPNLPPPVSAVDYYKTPLHYNNLWGGYREDQARVRAHQARHLQRDCDCKEKSQCNQPLDCANVTSGHCLPR